MSSGVPSLMATAGRDETQREERGECGVGLFDAGVQSGLLWLGAMAYPQRRCDAAPLYFQRFEATLQVS